MQEEIEHKTVNLAISTTKLSARTLLRGMQFLLRQYDKHASQGKQSMKRLVRQNRGVTNVEIQKTGIKDFDRYAKRYHIDYAIQKDLSCTPPRYMVYFKAQDTDALSAAFKEYSASVLDKTKGDFTMEFFNSAVDVLKTLVVALGAGLGVWGAINLLEGYGNDNPGSKSQGMKQLMAGGGVALVGITLIPLLSGLFG